MEPLISPERILVGARAADKWDAIRQLVDVFVDSGDLDHAYRARAYEAVCDREQRSSTGIGPGLAIPHAEFDHMSREIGALGIFREGVDFQGFDGRPSHFVLMLLYPTHDSDRHVLNLASAVRVLSSPGVGDRLRASEHPHEASEHLEHGGLVKRHEPGDIARP